MTELTIRPEEIRSAIETYVESYEPGNAREEVGRVTEAGDGIARVEGLQSAMTNELLEFEGGLLGVALNLDIREIGCVLLGPSEGIEEGQEVRRTGEVLSVPVGDAFLGRVVNTNGEPIDGKGEIVTTERRLLELQAPSVVQRQPVKEPLQTGIKAVDAMTNVGRGQQAETRDVKRCENVAGQVRPDYWDVTYNFRGEEHRMQMTTPPGPTVIVNERGEPRS